MPLTVEDKQIRRERIGASEVAGILGVSSYVTPWQIYMDKTQQLEDWEGNEATRLGQCLESGILDYAEQELGAMQRNVRILHDQLPLAATLDAQLIAGSIPVEAKTTGLVGHTKPGFGEAGTDELPYEYLIQVHAQLLCTRADLAYLFALIPGRGIVRYDIERNDSLSEKIGNYIDAWWTKHIVNKVEPANENVPLEIVKRVKRIPNKVSMLDEHALSLVTHIERMKEIRLDTQKRIDASETQLLLALGDSEAGQLPDGRLVTYYEQTRKPRMVDGCTFRVLRFKKGE